MNYQKLFDYMNKEHRLILLESDMQEIERIVLEGIIPKKQCDHKRVDLVRHACKCKKCGKVMETSF